MATQSPESWAQLIRKHFLIGWWGIALYMGLGIALETMHGFKLGYYLSVDNETRRLMWTLSHTHGTLLSLLNVAMAATLHVLQPKGPTDCAPPTLASGLTAAGWLLLPLGFFLGGLHFYGGDPGPGVLLVPVGALLKILGIILFCRTMSTLLSTSYSSKGRAEPQTSDQTKGRKRKNKR